MLDSTKPAVEVAVLGTVCARVTTYYVVFNLAALFLIEPLNIPLGLMFVYSMISVALIALSALMAAIALVCGVFTGTLSETWEALLQ